MLIHLWLSVTVLLLILQCSDTVDRVIRHVKQSHTSNPSLKVPLWETFWATGLTWSDLWKEAVSTKNESSSMRNAHVPLESAMQKNFGTESLIIAVYGGEVCWSSKSTVSANVSAGDQLPCGLRGCNNRPAPFPDQMSYKATKPGSVCPLS